MIDAVNFSSSYNAFWNECTPTCEHFIRRLNLDGLERFEPPMKKSATSRRAFIAEFAFSLFIERKKDDAVGGKKRSARAIGLAARLETKSRLAPYAAQGLDLGREFDDEERREVNEIAKSLREFFHSSEKKLILRPVFSGCGYIDASEGDVIFGKTIFEIKTVERPFRSNDIRQAITYAALNYAAKKFDVENIGLFNPRSGQFFDVPFDLVSWEISGKSSQELFSIIIQTVSNSGISR